MRATVVWMLCSALILAGGAASVAGEQEVTAEKTEELAAALAERLTPEGLQAQLEVIVARPRLSGSAGEGAAIDHVVETLRGDGIRVEVHELEAWISNPVSARVEAPEAGLSPEAITVAFSGGAEGLEGELVDVGSVDELPEPDLATHERLALNPSAATFPDVRGAVALVEGLPMPEAAWALERLGAAAAIFVNPEERLNELITTTVWGTPSTRNLHRDPALPVAQVRRGDGEGLRQVAAEGGRVRIDVEVDRGWRTLRLPVAHVEPPDRPEAPFVLLGGHIDSWHLGATDEGASNAAMVEIARAVHAERHRLRRGLRVAWWPGHSNGRYAGSAWYADRAWLELADGAVAYLNVDGIGMRDAAVFAAAATASLEPLARRVLASRGAPDARVFRPGRDSDQAFNGIGLPLLQFYHQRLAEDGGYWWWHTPEDTLDKIDPEVLETGAELYGDALAPLLAAPLPPVAAAAGARELGERLRELQESGGLDLSRALGLQARLLEVVASLQERLRAAAAAGPGRAELELAPVRILRPLHRVVYTLGGAFHPDPAVSMERLPGLAPALRAGWLDGPAAGFRRTTLVRERNRVVAALRESLERAERIRDRVGE